MEVSHYHGKNGIFTVDEYRKYCEDKRKLRVLQVSVPSIRMHEQNVKSKP